ncbi:MAG: hypothetical protein J5758_04305, partial [Abditibacteriota bacterium]|nr:hypothetical protein [Abditibacteriota bacterium]
IQPITREIISELAADPGLKWLCLRCENGALEQRLPNTAPFCREQAAGPGEDSRCVLAESGSIIEDTGVTLEDRGYRAFMADRTGSVYGIGRVEAVSCRYIWVMLDYHYPHARRVRLDCFDSSDVCLITRQTAAALLLKSAAGAEYADFSFWGITSLLCRAFQVSANELKGETVRAGGCVTALDADRETFRVSCARDRGVNITLTCRSGADPGGRGLSVGDSVTVEGQITGCRYSDHYSADARLVVDIDVDMEPSCVTPGAPAVLELLDRGRTEL